MTQNVDHLDPGTRFSSRQASATSSRTRAFNERQSSTPFNQPSIGWVGAINQSYQTSGILIEARDILAAWKRNTSTLVGVVSNKLIPFQLP